MGTNRKKKTNKPLKTAAGRSGTVTRAVFPLETQNTTVKQSLGKIDYSSEMPGNLKDSPSWVQRSLVALFSPHPIPHLSVTSPPNSKVHPPQSTQWPQERLHVEIRYSSFPGSLSDVFLFQIPTEARPALYVASLLIVS